MIGRIKKGVVLFSVLTAIAALVSAILATLAIVFAFKLTYEPMLISTAVCGAISAIFAYSIPFFLSALCSRVNMDKVARSATALGTTDAEKIAHALEWRVKPTSRLVRKCIKKKYI